MLGDHGSTLKEQCWESGRGERKAELRVSALSGSASWLPPQSLLVHLDPFYFGSMGSGDGFSMVLCNALLVLGSAGRYHLAHSHVTPQGPTLSPGKSSQQVLF